MPSIPCAFYLFIRAESGTTARGGNSSDGPGSRISAKREATYCRDRMAPDCTIRHPVWPIAALQRRVRFFARLAGFCRGRWHQRRVRSAEGASFSVFVSNLDFRVPSLRQIGVQALTEPCGVGKEATREARIEARATAPYRASTFWSRCVSAYMMSLFVSDLASILISERRSIIHPVASRPLITVHETGQRRRTRVGRPSRS